MLNKIYTIWLMGLGCFLVGCNKPDYKQPTPFATAFFDSSTNASASTSFDVGVLKVNAKDNCFYLKVDEDDSSDILVIVTTNQSASEIEKLIGKKVYGWYDSPVLDITKANGFGVKDYHWQKSPYGKCVGIQRARLYNSIQIYDHKLF